MISCFVCNVSVEPSKYRNHMLRHKKLDIIKRLFDFPMKSDEEIAKMRETYEKIIKDVLIIKAETMSSTKSNLSLPQEKDKEDNNNNVCITPKRSLRKRKRTLKATTYENSLKETGSDKELFSENESSFSSLSVLSKYAETEKEENFDLQKGDTLGESFNSAKEEPEEIDIKVDTNSDTCSVVTTSCHYSPIQEICENCEVPFTLPNDLLFNVRNIKCCLQCNIDLQANAQKEEIYFTTEVKVYICQYCNKEFINRENLKDHQNDHVKDSVLDDVLSLEKDYVNEYKTTNTLYNFFNAGYHYGVKFLDKEFNAVEFYDYFLKYSTNYNADQLDNFGYYCELCKFTYFNLSTLENHQRYFHLVNF